MVTEVGGGRLFSAQWRKRMYSAGAAFGGGKTDQQIRGSAKWLAILNWLFLRRIRGA
jgi:hypothetical protein